MSNALAFATPDTINAADLARAETDAAIAAAAGFSLADPIYALGTPVNAIGVDNYRRSRTDFEALPLLGSVAAGAVARIAAEQRRDIPTTFGALQMLGDGTVKRQ